MEVMGMVSRAQKIAPFCFARTVREYRGAAVGNGDSVC
jgi:hypothetical protein